MSWVPVTDSDRDAHQAQALTTTLLPMAVDLPRTSQPALSALGSAGFAHLEQLHGVPMRDVLALHGMGPKGIGALRRAMAEHGWAFAEDDPTVGAMRGGLVSLEPIADTEPAKKARRKDNQTSTTEVDPAAWIEELPTQRQRDHGRAMLTLFGEVTGAPARMWGPSMVGYGALHYTYESGRQGDMFQVGFSPRKASLTLYGLNSHPDSAALLNRLGPHKTSVACLYVTRLEQVDQDVLRELVQLGWDHEVTPDRS